MESYRFEIRPNLLLCNIAYSTLVSMGDAHVGTPFTALYLRGEGKRSEGV